MASLVLEFHKTFHHPYETYPHVLDPDRHDFRVWLIVEEMQELWDSEGDLDTIDALADIVYLCYGMALEMGVDLDGVIREVHAANMRKLGPDGQPLYREDGKVMKPDGWEGPDIAGELDRQRREWYVPGSSEWKEEEESV